MFLQINHISQVIYGQAGQNKKKQKIKAQEKSYIYSIGIEVYIQ
jgi:hypothetical protein